MSKQRTRSVGLLARWLAPVGLLVLAGCGADRPLNTLDPAGSKAEDINNLIQPVFVIAGIVFVLVMGCVLLIWWKFRVPAPQEGEKVYAGGYTDEEFPEQIHGIFKLEIAWTIAPAVLLSVIAVFSVLAILSQDDVAAAPADAAYPDLQITVVGQQWWWEYQYHLDGNTDTPPDIVTANEVVIPVGQDIRIQVTSRDVIHSFWIPRLNGKKDAVPGRVHPWVLQANEVGRFAGQCTEFCGLSHAYMRMYTVAVTNTDFEAWVSNQTAAREPLAEDDPNYEGEQLFIANCARCHVINGVTERDMDGDGENEPDTLAIYGTIEDYRDLTDGTLGQGMYTGASNLTAGAAPNLTYFATRSSYAGSFFELYPDAQELTEDGGYLDLSDGPYYRADLEAWLRDPPAQKPSAQPGDPRGMPDLGLDEADIDTITDYLISLD